MSDPTPVTQADGTQQLRGSKFGALLKRLHETLPLVSGLHGWIDEYTAAQLGIALILEALKFRSVDLMALTAGKVEKSRELEVMRVFLDFPDADATDPPTPFAVLTEAREGTYTATTGMHGVGIMDETLHDWGHNTVLLQHGHADFEFSVQVYLADKADRAGLRKRLVEIFVTEPEVDRAGRLVVLPFYFDQPVRYSVEGLSYPDDGDMAQANRWPLVLRLKASLRHVTLVEAPPVLRVAAPQVTVG